jgi:hypothetical protein
MSRSNPSRGDGFLVWLGACTLGFAFYAAVAGSPSSLADLSRFVVVPVCFGTVLAVVRGFARRL